MACQPEKWDYVSAGIPSALTEELEAAQLSKKVSLDMLLSMLQLVHVLNLLFWFVRLIKRQSSRPRSRNVKCLRTKKRKGLLKLQLLLKTWK